VPVGIVLPAEKQIEAHYYVPPNTISYEKVVLSKVVIAKNTYVEAVTEMSIEISIKDGPWDLKPGEKQDNIDTWGIEATSVFCVNEGKQPGRLRMQAGSSASEDNDIPVGNTAVEFRRHFGGVHLTLENIGQTKLRVWTA
jgi:hypothetical protein